MDFYKGRFVPVRKRYPCCAVGFVADNKVENKTVLFLAVDCFLNLADYVNGLVGGKYYDIAAFFFLGLPANWNWRFMVFVFVEAGRAKSDTLVIE